MLWNNSGRENSKWRFPTPDETDVLLGFPPGYTDVQGVDSTLKEQMLGNTMHVEAVVRLLRDLPIGDAPPLQTQQEGTPA